MTLSATIKTDIVATLAGSPDIGSASHTIDEKLRFAFTEGTGLEQATDIFSDAFTGQATQTYDLAGGVVNALGQTLTFAAIKAIIVKNTGTSEITYGGGASPFLGFIGAAAHTLKIPAGGMLVLVDPTAAGQAVVAGTGDVLTLTGTAISGSVWVIGEA